MTEPLPLPPIALGREEAAEILGLIDPLTKAMEELPYKKAQPSINLLDAIRDLICEAVPGGFLDLCEGCGTPIGVDDPGTVGDSENGIWLCRKCAPSPEEIAEQQAQIAAENDPDFAEVGEAPADYPYSPEDGWVTIVWPSPIMPNLPVDALIDFRDLGRVNGYFTAPAGSLDWDRIAAYRFHREADIDTARARETRLKVKIHVDQSWVSWDGIGPCPLHDDAAVEVLFADGQTDDKRRAGEWNWGRAGLGPLAIVSYRLRLNLPEASDRRVPRYYGSEAVMAAPVDWSNAEEAEAALDLGRVPPGYSIEDGVLIVPSEPINITRVRGHGLAFSRFAEVRDNNGKVLKTANKNWAPPEREERQFMFQLLKAKGPVTAYHGDTRRTAARLWANGEVDEVEGLNGRPAYVLTAKGAGRAYLESVAK